MPSTHIDHVIRRLEYVIQWSIQHQSRMGYFAALYQRVTIEVDRNIDKFSFRQNEKMMMFDVIFAEYYLAAFEGYMRGEEISEVWKVAFDKTKDSRLTVLQHLLLGMNAHINLDLAVTVSNMATTETLDEIKPDFYKINKVLSGLVDLVQDQISEIYGPLKWLDRIMGRVDEMIVDRLMARFRDRAWRLAEELTHLSGNDRVKRILEVDREMAHQAERTIARPLGTHFRPLAYFIRKREDANIAKIIRTMHQGKIYHKWEQSFI